MIWVLVLKKVVRLEETTQKGGDGARGYIGAAALVGVYMGQGGSPAPSLTAQIRDIVHVSQAPAQYGLRPQTEH